MTEGKDLKKSLRTRLPGCVLVDTFHELAAKDGQKGSIHPADPQVTFPIKRARTPVLVASDKGTLAQCNIHSHCGGTALALLLRLGTRVVEYVPRLEPPDGLRI
ncbi:unnamed protein product [Fusarium graminearum]|nr:unnamed protein product [Fusarium graminearum]